MRTDAEATERHERWKSAVPKLCRSLSEAGYPARPLSDPSYLSYVHCPPSEVLRKAFELCGIGDLWHDSLYAATTERLVAFQACVEGR